MANRLEFSTSVDGSGFRSGILSLEKMAADSSGRLTRSLTGGDPAIGLEKRKRHAAAVAEYEERLARKAAGAKAYAEKKAAQEAAGGTTLMGGRPRRAGGSFAVSSTMFLSAARLALASGANPLTGFMQQAPQIAQGFTMMGAAALKSAAKFIGWGAVVVGLGAAFYALLRHIGLVREEQRNFQSMLDTTNLSMNRQLALLRENAAAHQAQVDWVRRHGMAQRDLGEAVMEAMDAMRKKHALERQLASARGATPQQMAQLEIQQAQTELAALRSAAEAAERRHHASFAERGAAATELQRFNTGDQNVQLEAARERAGLNAKIVAAIGEKMRSTLITEIDPEKSRMAGGPVYNIRGANSRDKMEVEVEGKRYVRSLAEARDALNAVTSVETSIGGTQKQLEEALKEKTQRTEDELKTYQDLKKQGDQAQADLALRQQFLPQIAAAQRSGGTTPSDSLTTVGNFLGSSRNMIETLAQRQVDLLGLILTATRETATNTNRGGSGSAGGNPWPTP